MNDNVNHPVHYNVAGYEVIDIIEAFTKDIENPMSAYETGNIIKYILRWPHKNGLEDLKKARWYLNHMIARIEALEAWEDKEDDDDYTYPECPDYIYSDDQKISVMEDEDAKREMLQDWIKEMTEKGVKITDYGKKD